MGRTKNQIQKPATVHLLNNGRWAVFVTLVSPQELEGKVRSGRQKFERQTEALANNLCVEINAHLCGKKLARQLSDREQTIAKKLFWDIISSDGFEYIHSSVWLPAGRLVWTYCQPTASPARDFTVVPSIEKVRPLGVWDETLHQKPSSMDWFKFVAA